MARNVTEQELDALLARPDAPRPAVESRDFQEPRWLSPEDLEALQRAGRAAGRTVVEALNSALPLQVDLEGVEVSEDSLDSGLRDPRPQMVALVSDAPVGPSLVTIDLGGALLLSELALGIGDASPIALRELSPLEAQIVERLLAQAFARVTQAFGLTAKEPRFVSDRTELARVLASEGDRRRVAMRVVIGLGAHTFVLHFLLAGVTPPPRKSNSNAPQKQATKAALPAEIASMQVEVSAILDQFEIMLTDLLALEAGDLIPLTVAPGESIVLRIEGEACGRGRFGERDGRMAVRLTEILRPSSTR